MPAPRRIHNAVAGRAESGLHVLGAGLQANPAARLGHRAVSPAKTAGTRMDSGFEQGQVSTSPVQH